METFLGWWFVGSVVAWCWLWKKWVDTRSDLVTSQIANAKLRMECAEFITLGSDFKDKYENLVIEIQKKALTATPSKPQNQVRKATYSGIRKAVEADNRNAETLEARREADTAFQE